MLWVIIHLPQLSLGQAPAPRDPELDKNKIDGGMLYRVEDRYHRIIPDNKSITEGKHTYSKYSNLNFATYKTTNTLLNLKIKTEKRYCEL